MRCGRSGFVRGGKFYHDGTASTACNFREKVAALNAKLNVTIDDERRVDHATASPERKAWIEGEYDGYWRQPHRTGKYTNQVWAQYLRGYLAGVKARIEEPTDEELDAWLRKVTAELSEGER